MTQAVKEFELRLSADGMAVLIDVHSLAGDLEEMTDAIMQELTHLDVNPLPPGSRVKAWLRNAAAHETSLKDVVLIKGKPLGKATHARVEWTGDYFNTGFAVDEVTGAMDYRRRLAEENVSEGQLLGKQLPFCDGLSGATVTGEKVPGEEALVYYPNVGKNVRLDLEEGTYYSKIDGRIRLVDDVISVDNVYMIPGSVGLESGHISHNGAVVVKGDVLENARIEATGNIEVCGVVEAADIKTQGNLLVHRGILRSDDRVLEVAGSLTAKFILDAKIEAGNDVNVEREIVNSSVKTVGAVVIPKGRIVGGEIIALRGINVGQASTVAAVPTRLLAGENYRFTMSLESMQKEINRVAKDVGRLHKQVDPYDGTMGFMSEKQEKTLGRLRLQLSQKEVKLERLEKDLSQIRKEGEDRARFQIVVEKELYRGTTVGIGQERLRINEDHKEPVRIEINNGAIEVIPKNAPSASPANQIKPLE